MSTCQTAKLADRGVIRIAGADAVKFLQGLITNDMDRVKPGACVHAGLLTPQGKILFDFFIVAGRGGYLLDCARDQVANLLQRLGYYKLRADVDILDLSDEHEVWAVWNGRPEIPGALGYFPDPRLAALGARLIVPQDTGPAPGCAAAGEADYHAHRIALGVPEGGRDYAFGAVFPHEADFDQLNGIDFKKGCFVGQEVVSRMEHRGTARKRIVPVEGETSLAPGAAIAAGEASLGSIGSVSGARALALVRLDRAESALKEGQPLTAGGVVLRLLQPDWAGFRVPTRDGA